MRLPTTSVGFTRSIKVNRKVDDFELRVCGSKGLLPYRFSPDKSKNFPFLQAERGFVYQKSLGATIGKLLMFAGQLRDSSKAATFVTQSAVSPAELQQLVETVWDDEYEKAGALSSNLVPGYFAGEEQIFETGYASANSNSYTASAAALSESSNLFSAPIPFGRADFGPSSFYSFLKAEDTTDGFFYVTSRYDYDYYSLSETVVSAGHAKLRVAPSTFESFASYPWKGGFNMKSTYIGNDFISLLDACAKNESLYVDLYSWHPTGTPGASADYNAVATSLNETKCCAMFPAYFPTSPNPFLTVPVACPAPLVQLGKKRLASKLAAPKFNSHLRPSFETLVLSQLSTFERAAASRIANIISNLPDPNSYIASTDDAPFVQKVQSFTSAAYNTSNPSDFKDRASVLKTLLIDPDTVRVTADPKKYYAACAPVQCTWIESSTRTDCKSST